MVLYTYKYWFKMLKWWRFPPLIKARASSTNCTMGNLTCSRHATYLHTIYVKSPEIHIRLLYKSLSIPIYYYVGIGMYIFDFGMFFVTGGCNNTLQKTSSSCLLSTLSFGFPPPFLSTAELAINKQLKKN